LKWVHTENNRGVEQKKAPEQKRGGPRFFGTGFFESLAILLFIYVQNSL
jgi:hypothetical protein